MPNVKPKEFARRLSVRVPESVYKAIDGVIRHRGLSKSGFIRQILTEALRIEESEVNGNDQDRGLGS